MNKPEFHLFLCNSFRAGGEAKGVCVKKDSSALLQYIEGEIIDRGLDAMITSCGCIKACDHGPVLMIYPQGWWYGEVNEEKVDQILDGLEEDSLVEELAI